MRPIARALTLAALVGAAAGCGSPQREAQAPPLFTAVRSDIAVVFEPGQRGDAGSTAGWLNRITQEVGPVQVVSPSSPADSLPRCRVLIVPSAHAADRKLPAAARAAADSGGLVLVDLPEEDDPKARERWAELQRSASTGRVLLAESGRDDGEAFFELVRVALLPRLDAVPAAWSATELPAIAGPAQGVSVQAEAAAARNISPSAFVAAVGARVEDLERIRQANAAIGFLLDGAATHARQQMLKIGATEDEASTALSLSPLPPASRAHLVSAGIRRIAVPRAPGAESRALPFQADDESGRLLPLLIVPCSVTKVTDPTQTEWIDTASAHDASAWITRLDAYSRFWEARARTPLFSAWDGTRLRAEVDAQVEGLALLIPVTAPEKTLAEILHEGAAVQGEPVDTPAGPAIRLPLGPGKNVVWAIYQ